MSYIRAYIPIIPKIFLLALLVFTSRISANNDNLEVSVNLFADCLCAVELTKAYEGFENHITKDNLEPLYRNLRTTTESIQENTAKEEDIKPNIEKSNKIYRAKIMEAKEFLFELKKLKKQI